MSNILFKKVGLRLGLTLLICLGWYMIKKSSIEYILTYPVFIIAILFFAIAWFDYLNLDGVSINNMSFIRMANTISNKVGADHIEPNRNSVANDALACVYSNLIVGGILIIPAILFSIF